MNYFEHHLPTASKEDAIFQLGTLMGVIKTFKDFLHEKQQENLTAQIYQKQVLSVKHLKDIILLLEAHGIMSQFRNMQKFRFKRIYLIGNNEKSSFY